MKAQSMRVKKRINTGEITPKKTAKKRNAIQAALIIKTHEAMKASKKSITTRQIRRVINGECENDLVMKVYMELLEGGNELLEKVKELVPFE